MKKILVLIFCIVLAFGLMACGDQGDVNDEAQEPSAEEEANTDAAEPSGDLFTFSTETFEGEAFSSEDVKDAKLVMVNLWEPWCGPCVGEMPDLEKVYEEFKDDGFVILGVFTDTTMDEDAAQILKDAGITYPILRATNEFAVFQTNYVPTTVFLTGEGKRISDEPIIGAQSYETWHSAVKGLLEGQADD